ncbi:aldehyde-activating protein [Bradyrhizobium sp. SK17]|uniref:GFA family protein n=1 Tax=Bradyrhizobium sp. SK17 TaxID=2057741 RepID=UPI000C30403E|nr:aldehyde-activating protein [Bradyrhizobium sp. SK17]
MSWKNPRSTSHFLGGCLCGAVRYSLNGAPILVHVCHCHDCQSASGSAYSLTVIVPTAALALTGPLESFSRTTARGREVRYAACSNCRAGLTSNDAARPDFTGLRAGTLDDASWAVPIAQTFVQSAIPWAIIPGVEQVDPKDFSYVSMSAAWRATAPIFSPHGRS